MAATVEHSITPFGFPLAVISIDGTPAAMVVDRGPYRLTTTFADGCTTDESASFEDIIAELLSLVND